MDFHSPRLTWIQLLQGVSDLPTAETTTETQIWHFSLGRPTSNLVSGLLHWTTSSMEKTTLCPYWSRNLFWLWICLSCIAMLLPNPPSMGLCYPPSWYSIQYCFSPGNSLHSREMWQWIHDHEFHWSYSEISWFSPSWSSWPDRWNSLLKAQLLNHLGGNSLEDWGRVLQKADMLWISVQYIVWFLTYLGSTDSGIKDKKGIVQLTITPNDPLGKNLLPIPASFSFSGLKVLFPEGKFSCRSHSKYFIELEVQTFLWPTGLLKPLNQQA